MSWEQPPSFAVLYLEVSSLFAVALERILLQTQTLAIFCKLLYQLKAPEGQ
jgi:hypothetical protein